MSTKIQAPTNNKSLFHTLCVLMEQIANDEIPLEKADRLIAVAGKLQSSLEIELKRAKTEFEIGERAVRIREIELTNPDA